MSACVPRWSTCQRACVPAWLTYQRASVAKFQKRAKFSFFTCHCVIRRAIVLSRCANVPNGVLTFQTFLSRIAKENFYTILLHKEFYISLDIIVIHIICICIINKNCLILYFYTSCHIKEKFVEFFLFSFSLFS